MRTPSIPQMIPGIPPGGLNRPSQPLGGTADRAVVVSVRVTVEFEAPLSVTADGENTHVAACGSPVLLHPSSTAWLNPLDGVRVTV